jgi:cyclin T
MLIKKIRSWRRQYIECIFQAGIRLKLPPWAITTAALYCHTFFSLKSMKKNDRFLIASACLHLAAKVQEAPKSIKDVIHACDGFRYSGNTKKMHECNDPAKMDERKEEVLMAERALLYTLGFNMDDSNACSLLLKILAELGLGSDSPSDHPSDHPSDSSLSVVVDKRFTHLPQTAWDLLNDSYRTQVCLKMEPRKLACAAIFMADLSNQHEQGSMSIVDLINEKETSNKSGMVRI